MKNRIFILDIIRIFSLYLVISVHFLLHTGFYEQLVYGKKMLLMCILRSFFIICVPMFITLTGYLMNKVNISKKHYLSIKNTLFLYLICSIICFIYFKHYNLFDKSLIEGILNFSAAKYAWYIEMYIGLFMLIPFFNITINNINSKKEYKLLLLILMIIIGLPCVINSFSFFKNSNNYIKLIPSWWTNIYPIFYYFLGAYFSKFKINKAHKKELLVLLIISIIIFGLFDYYKSFKLTFICGPWNDYCSIFVMITTYLTFLLLLKFNKEINNKKIILLFTILSNSCLGAFLISCIFDNIIYTILNNKIPVITDRFLYEPIISLSILVLSLFSSVLITYSIKLTKKTINNILQKRIKCL